MSWFVLHCRTGQEKQILRSCRYHLSEYALEDAFVFYCERLCKSQGEWKILKKDMFPGYIFLESNRPSALLEELKQYRTFCQIMEESEYLCSVYEDEEENLRRLCGNEHCLSLSYGYKDRGTGVSRITEGPLSTMQSHIKKIDWHRRYAQIELPLRRKPLVVWAGLDFLKDGAICGT